ncbi:MAG: exosortase U [Planctomycetaceae bacterium]
MAAQRSISRTLPDASWAWFVACAVVAYAVPLTAHGQRLWQRDYFQFFPVFFVALMFVAWQHRSEIGDLCRENWHTGLVSAGLALLTLGFSVWMRSSWLAAVSALLLGDALLAELPILRSLWRTLVILIPLPLGFDATLVQKLQRLSSQGASGVLDALQIDHLMSGNVLELPNRRLFVEEACSGVSSFYTLMAVALLYVAAVRPRAVVACLLLPSVAWWSIVSNVLRISAIAVADAWYAVDLTEGTSHTILGCGVLAFSVAMIGSTLRLLRFVLESITTSGSGITEQPGARILTPIALWNLLTVTDRRLLPGHVGDSRRGMSLRRRTLLRTLAVCVVAAPVANAMLLVGARSHANGAGTRRGAVLPSLPENLFADAARGLSVVGVEDTVERQGLPRRQFGPQSRTWTLQQEDRTIVVSVDGPFSEWHDQRVSYRNQDSDPNNHAGAGWRILGTEFDDTVTRVELTSGRSEYKSLYFGSFRDSGQKVPVPREVAAGSIPETVVAALARRGDEGDTGDVWQMQLVVTRTAQPLGAESAADRQLFDVCLARVLRHWKAQR